MPLRPGSFHCSEEVLQVGLGDREVGAGQGGGGRGTVVKILSGCISAIRRLQDLKEVAGHWGHERYPPTHHAPTSATSACLRVAEKPSTLVPKNLKFSGWYSRCARLGVNPGLSVVYRPVIGVSLEAGQGNCAVHCLL